MELYLSQNLITLRKAHKLTQSEAATDLHLGRSTYANYENGVTEPELSKILEIAKRYFVSVDELLSEKLETDTYLAELNDRKLGNKMTGNLTSIVTANSVKTEDQTNQVGNSEDDTQAQQTTLWLLLKEMREMRHSIDKLNDKDANEEK